MLQPGQSDLISSINKALLMEGDQLYQCIEVAPWLQTGSTALLFNRVNIMEFYCCDTIGESQ